MKFGLPTGLQPGHPQLLASQRGRQMSAARSSADRGHPAPPRASRSRAGGGAVVVSTRCRSAGHIPRRPLRRVVRAWARVHPHSLVKASGYGSCRSSAQRDRHERSARRQGGLACRGAERRSTERRAGRSGRSARNEPARLRSVQRRLPGVSAILPIRGRGCSLWGLPPKSLRKT